MGILGKCVAAVVLLFAVSSFAQTRVPYVAAEDLPDAPSEVLNAARSYDATNSGALLKSSSTVRPVMAVAVAHAPAKVADAHFWLVNAYHLFWTVADVEITAAGMRADSTCHEYNPLVPRRPSRLALYASNIPVLAGAAYLSYRAKKHHGKHWPLWPTLAGSLHAAAFVWDATGSTCLK